MDFFASKVAMSICALLVIAVLSGATDRSRFVGGGEEVQRILQEFCDLADHAFEGRSEGTLRWTVPALSTGDEIELTLDHGRVECEWASEKVIREPQCLIHTWKWDGSATNESRVAGLDRESSKLTTHSGGGISLRTVYVMVENDFRLLVFASTELG